MKLKRLLLSLLTLLAAASPAFAQFNWVNWSYPAGTLATANVGPGTVNLRVSGANIAQVNTADYPIQFQSGFPYTQITGDSAGAQNLGTSQFGMELDFNSFISTAGLVLAIGNIGKVPGFAGYVLSAFDSSNNPIALSSFGQFGHFDNEWLPPNGGILFNDDLALNTGTGNFNVTIVPGQNTGNSDMLILSLPAGVSKIFVNLQNPAQAVGDTINFMVAPQVPEPASLSLAFVGGIVALIGCRRQIRRLAS
jgi:hypothetical protein